jgi:ABC-type antimicrobial peptide transport system permease subunit
MFAAVPVILYGYYYPFKLTGEMADMMLDMGYDPLMPFAWFDSYFFAQGIVVFCMVLAACIYPMRKILKLDAIKAIRGI